MILEKGTAMTTTTPAIGGGNSDDMGNQPINSKRFELQFNHRSHHVHHSSLQTTAVAYTIWATTLDSNDAQMNITINDTKSFQLSYLFTG